MMRTKDDSDDKNMAIQGICKDDNDTIKPGRITMKPTTEQNLA